LNSVIEMTRATPAAFLGREFDEFLFSPIGDNDGEMPLTVLSALARQGVDPWQEAANLAQLPRDDAARRLTSWIAALPDSLTAQRESGTIAARLMALLPGRTSATPQAPAPMAAKSPMVISRPVIAFIVFMAFLIGVQFIMSMNQSPSEVGKANQPAPAAATQQEQAPVAGR